MADGHFLLQFASGLERNVNVNDWSDDALLCNSQHDIARAFMLIVVLFMCFTLHQMYTFNLHEVFVFARPLSIA